MTKGRISELLANRHSGGRSQDSSTECGQGWNLYLGCYIICACHWTQMFYHWDLGEERIVSASHLRGHSHSWWGRQECSVAIEVSLSYHLCTQETKRKMGSWQGGGVSPWRFVHSSGSSLPLGFCFPKVLQVSKASTKQCHLLENQPSHTWACGDISHPWGPSARPSAGSSLGYGCRLFSLKNLHLWCVLFI